VKLGKLDATKWQRYWMTAELGIYADEKKVCVEQANVCTHVQAIAKNFHACKSRRTPKNFHACKSRRTPRTPCIII